MTWSVKPPPPSCRDGSRQDGGGLTGPVGLSIGRGQAGQSLEITRCIGASATLLEPVAQCAGEIFSLVGGGAAAVRGAVR